MSSVTFHTIQVFRFLSPSSTGILSSTESDATSPTLASPGLARPWTFRLLLWNVKRWRWVVQVFNLRRLHSQRDVINNTKTTPLNSILQSFIGTNKSLSLSLSLSLSTLN
ncbi:hypothetical protein Mapa_003569 [Marchantia paleacea]|nr:hypothetical protein Mapa_003569 [Marchantia paleacea]